MRKQEQIWTIIRKNMEEFVRLNDYFGDDPNFPKKRKKWFLKVHRKDAIITIHPQGGQEDLSKKLSQFAYQKTDKPITGEIVGARTSETYWFGPFDDLYSAYGYACLTKRFYRMITGQEMPIRSGYTKEFNFSVGGVSF